MSSSSPLPPSLGPDPSLGNVTGNRASPTPGNIEVSTVEPRIGEIEVDTAADTNYSGTIFTCVRIWREQLNIQEDQIQDIDCVHQRNGEAIQLTTWEYTSSSGEKHEFWAVPMDLTIKYMENGVLQEKTITIKLTTFLEVDASHPGAMKEDQRVAFQLGGLSARLGKVYFAKDKSGFNEKEKTAAETAKLANRISLPTIPRAYRTESDMAGKFKSLPSYRWTEIGFGKHGSVDNFDMLSIIDKTSKVGGKALSEIDRRRELEKMSFEIVGKAPIATRLRKIDDLLDFDPAKARADGVPDPSFGKQLKDAGLSEVEYIQILAGQTEQMELEAKELTRALEASVRKKSFPFHIPLRGKHERIQNLKPLIEAQETLKKNIKTKNTAIANALGIPDLTGTDVEKMSQVEIEAKAADQPNKDDIVKLVNERDNLVLQSDQERDFHEVTWLFTRMAALEQKLTKVESKTKLLEEENQDLKGAGAQIQAKAEKCKKAISQWEAIFDGANPDKNAFKNLAAPSA